MNTHRFICTALLSALILAAPGMLRAQRIVWEHEYGTNGRDLAFDVLGTSDGGYITAGYSQESGNVSGYLVKVDRDGILQWQRNVDAMVRFVSIIPWKDGGWVVVGDILDAMYVAGLDANGMVQWRDTIAEAGVGIQKVVPAQDGGFLVAGDINPAINREEGIVLGKYDSDGRRSWVRKLDAAGMLDLVDIVATKDGGYVFTGSGLFPDRHNNDMFVAGINAEGEPRFLHSLPLDMYDGAHGVLPTGDGGYLLGGFALDTVNMGYSMLLTKFGSDGEVQWLHLHGAGTVRADQYEFRDMVNMNDGGYTVLAMNGGRYPYLLRLDANGRELWDTTYVRNEPVRQLLRITHASDGGLILAGYSDSEGMPEQVLIMKIDLNGVSAVKDPEDGMIEKLWLK